MQSVFPSYRDLTLSREGLSFAEIMSDGLMHFASVFGVPHNERFLERVAAIGFMNGIVMQGRAKPAEVSTLVQRLEETLSPASGTAMSDIREDQVSKDALNHIRDYWGTPQVRRLNRTHSSTRERARQIIAAAVMQGLQAHEQTPVLGKQCLLLSEAAPMPHELIISRVWTWNVCSDGQPMNYPLLEPIGNYVFYVRPETFMLGQGIRDALPHLVQFDDVWEFSRWTDEGHSWGQALIQSIPDVVEKTWKALPSEVRTERLAMRETYRISSSPAEAFMTYFQRHSVESGIDSEEVIASSPQIHAIRAFHFGIWCAAHDAGFQFRADL